MTIIAIILIITIYHSHSLPNPFAFTTPFFSSFFLLPTCPSLSLSLVSSPFLSLRSFSLFYIPLFLRLFFFISSLCFSLLFLYHSPFILVLSFSPSLFHLHLFSSLLSPYRSPMIILSLYLLLVSFFVSSHSIYFLVFSFHLASSLLFSLFALLSHFFSLSLHLLITSLFVCFHLFYYFLSSLLHCFLPSPLPLSSLPMSLLLCFPSTSSLLSSLPDASSP